MTKSFVPLPEIPFIFVKVSAKCTVKPLAPLVASFTTRILTPLVIVVAVVSTFAPPFTVKVSPNVRVTPWLSSPVKVNGFPFNVLIRVSNLETASPTLFTVSVPAVVPSFVIVYVGGVQVPLASTAALPPRAVANSVLAVCN